MTIPLVSRPRVRKSRLTASIALALGVGLGATACVSQDSPAPTVGELLTVGYNIPPTTLDPAKAGGAMTWYTSLAYDSLVYMAPDGSLEPQLAESWDYVGDGNTDFEFRLRPDVVFSDGTPLTAEVVKANIEYAQNAASEASAALASIDDVQVVDDLTVHLHFSTPNPLAARMFSQHQFSGFMISGEALESPEELASETFGAGPYVLDSTESVPNDHYTYVRNDTYWNPDAQHYESIVIKVLPNPNTALSALQTGQVDLIPGDASTVDAASTSGFGIVHEPLTFFGLAIADRDGELVPALGDVRVRQALNYAVDREKITAALYGDYGVPTEQIVLPGQDGYVEGDVYSYDPEKAKELLAEAGYPDGFTAKVMTFELQSLVVQAIADDLGKIGVTLELDNTSDPTTYVSGLTSGQYAIYGISYGTFPLHLMAPQLFLQGASLWNPLDTADADLAQWYAQAASATPDERAGLYQQMSERLVEQGWFVPVTFVDQLWYVSPNVAGVEASPARPSVWPSEWYPAP